MLALSNKLKYKVGVDEFEAALALKAERGQTELLNKQVAQL